MDEVRNRDRLPERASAARLYAFLTRSGPLSNGAFTRAHGSVRHGNQRSLVMLDLFYLALGLAVFVAFAFATRFAERL
ncbi:hypothetical protein I5731_14655 [Methylobrevis sp. L22]|uniref:Uncharacterized protein n=1 Tax=Methylobrevis albus TaxID=2793297 RepID=A0A931N0S2_9HYPH|nr:hypothetical protein [Methylobrevis albus]